MKRLVMFGIVLVCALVMGSMNSAFAAEVKVPMIIDGNGVVGDSYVQTVEGAVAGNVTARIHDRIDPWVSMEKKGDNWYIPGLECNEQFSVYIGDHVNEYKPMTNFAKAELKYGSPYLVFRDRNQTQPCLVVPCK